MSENAPVADPHPPRFSFRFWQPETGLFLLLWLFLLLVGRSKLLRDPGTFWHTMLGERMLTTGQLVRGDPFNFTFNNPQQHPWIPHQWLGECLMALLHRIDRLDTLLLATATILTGLYTWMAHRLIRAGLHWSVACLVVVLVFAASASHFHARPHLATIVFLGTTFAALCDFEAGRSSLGRCAWLVPIYLLWTNLHGGMLGGLVTMTAALVGWCAWRSVGWDSPIRSLKDALAWIAVIAACGLTAFVNPYGAELPRTWLAIVGQPLSKIIQEHARLNVTMLSGLAVLVFGAVYLAALVSLTRRPRVTWLLPLLWLGLACTGIRHAPLFGITAGLALADVLPYTRWAASQVRSGADLFVPPKEKARFGWQPLVLPTVAVLAALGLQAGHVAVPLVGHDWARLDPTHWPVELEEQLKEAQPSQPDETRPIFNDLSLGGYVIYTAPRLRVFVDDRCELYGYPWLKRYVDAKNGVGTAEAMAEWQREYRPFALALVQTSTDNNPDAFDDYFKASPDWEVVKRTPTATLYRRKARPPAKPGAGP